MNFPGVNSATFIEDIFLLTQTRLHQQPLYISVLLKASVSQLCIRTKKKRSSNENSFNLHEIKADHKALITFCLKSHFTEELNCKLKVTCWSKKGYVYIRHPLVLSSNSIFIYSYATSTSTCEHMNVEQTLNAAVSLWPIKSSTDCLKLFNSRLVWKLGLRFEIWVAITAKTGTPPQRSACKARRNIRFPHQPWLWLSWKPPHDNKKHQSERHRRVCKTGSITKNIPLFFT